MKQTALITERSGQQLLDQLGVQRWDFRMAPRARCPLCGRLYRTVPKIARRRALQHARRVHNVELEPWQVEL